MHLISYAGYEGPRRTIPVRKPQTRHERRWAHKIDPVTRTQAAMDEFNREGMRVFNDRGMPAVYREVVRVVARAHGINVMLLASKSRMRIAVLARNEAMYKIKAHDNRVSMPKLGRWFERDHTSVLYCIACHQDRNKLPLLVGFDLVRIRRRNAMVAAQRVLSKAAPHSPAETTEQ